MEFVFLIPVAAIAVLVAAVTWSRRGQSRIGLESGGDSLEQVRRKEKGLGGGNNPTGSPGDWPSF